MKRQPYRNKKILKAAQGEECTMRIPGVCNENPETVVFCHSNLGEDGKGLSQKADDCFGFFGCSACHYWYDNGAYAKDRKTEELHKAMKRTWRRLLDKGVLK